MKQTLSSWALGLSILLSTVGCSTYSYNEGAIDHRMLTGASDDTAKFNNRFFSPEQLHDDGLVPSDLWIQEGDAIEIRLLQGFICDFRELSWKEIYQPSGKKHQAPSSGGGQNKGEHCQGHPKTRGEIVVLANVVERGTGAGLDFSTAGIKEQGRVVFYSEDVRESSQYLNFANLPIYGPMTYTGRPLYIELNVVEIDAGENQATNALLGQLATLGASAYPPAASALGILESVGSAFLQGNDDDLEFRYQMELEAPGGMFAIKAPLAIGIYAFIRSENRDADPAWGELDFEPETGRLVDRNGLPFRAATYFTVAISKPAKSFELDAGQSFAEFEKAMQASDTESPDFDVLRQRLEAIRERDAVRKAMGDLDNETVVGTLALERVLAAVCEVVGTPTPPSPPPPANDQDSQAGTAGDGDGETSGEDSAPATVSPQPAPPTDPLQATAMPLERLVQALEERAGIGADKLTQANLQQVCSKTTLAEQRSLLGLADAGSNTNGTPDATTGSSSPGTQN